MSVMQTPYGAFLAKIRYLQDAKSADEFYQRLESVLIKDDGQGLSTLVEEMANQFMGSLALIQDKHVKDAMYHLFAIYDSTTFVSLLSDDPTALASPEVRKELKDEEDEIRSLVKGLIGKSNLPPKSNPPS